jgi:heavy metal sensor kinase
VTVRARLTLLNVLVFTAVMTALGLIVREHVRQNLEAGIDRSLVKRDFRNREPRRPPRPEMMLTEDNIEIWRGRWAAQSDPNAPAFPIFDAHGENIVNERLATDVAAIEKVVASNKPLLSTVGTTRCFTFPVPAESIGPGMGNFAFQFTESLEQTNEAVAQFTRSLLTMIPLAMLLAAGGGLFLTSRALRPIRAATEAAGRIGASDLSERLPVSGRDEFARLAETLNGMLARLEAAFERQRRFVADASHELRTPLTVIKANTSLALTDPTLPDDTRETLDEIDGAVDRTTRIVQDMLHLARTDAGQLTLQREPVALKPLLDDLAAEAPHLHPDGASVTVAAPEGITADVDPHHLRRMLTNLLDNALRHTPASGSVTLTAGDEGPFVVLRVADTGSGISPAHLPHLGERFYRADASRARTGGGTGLGLAISRSIAEAHGGTLTIESEPGNGTRIQIVLPKA